MATAKEWAEKVEAVMAEAQADGVEFDYVEEDDYGGCACSSGYQRLYAIKGTKYKPKSFVRNPSYEEVRVDVP